MSRGNGDQKTTVTNCEDTMTDNEDKITEC